MYLKSLTFVAAVLVFVNCVDIEDSPKFLKYFNTIKDHGNLDVCNKSVCDLPCQGAGPPPRCPDHIPYCITGCACLLDCENDITVCYEPKYCLDRRRFLTGKKRNKTITN